jgi:hypothetical protein
MFHFSLSLVFHTPADNFPLRDICCVLRCPCFNASFHSCFLMKKCLHYTTGVIRIIWLCDFEDQWQMFQWGLWLNESIMLPICKPYIFMIFISQRLGQVKNFFAGPDIAFLVQTLATFNLFCHAAQHNGPWTISLMCSIIVGLCQTSFWSSV